MQAAGPTTMPSTKRLPRLVHHLVWVVALKLVLLIALWFAFVSGHRVTTAPAQVAERLTGAGVEPAAAPSPDQTTTT